jgi:cobalt-precorrin 5A hydrolase
MNGSRRSYAIYAITKHGIGIAERLAHQLAGSDLYVSDKLRASAPAGARLFPLPMGPLLADTFTGYDCHVFVISVGAVVRMIAPLIRDKKVDPAVISVDDDARFAVCVLSGHVGRGNAFAARVAERLGAQPVITTASDVRGTLTVDILGRELGWQLDDPDRNVTRGCAAVVNAAPVLFVQETGEANWWPEDKPLPEGVRYATSLSGVDPRQYEILLVASDRVFGESERACWENAVVYRPRSLVVGLGCDMNVCSRSCSVAAREIRAKAATEKNASAKIVLILLGPRLCAMASASTSDGNAISTSSRRMMIGSSLPPQ